MLTAILGGTVTAVMHSSGSAILVGKAGYIAGTLGSAVATILIALPF